jgi:hypothetical protein
MLWFAACLGVLQFVTSGPHIIVGILALAVAAYGCILLALCDNDVKQFSWNLRSYLVSALLGTTIVATGFLSFAG